MSFKILRHLFLTKGRANYFGERASTASHMLQSANFAKANNYDKDLIVASLFHDIGHLLADDNTNGHGVSDHARIGASFLRGLGLSERTCRAVEFHVDAKRFLTGNSPHYKLSEASRQTLAFQGGAMFQSELIEFQSKDYFADAILVRKTDDAGKHILEENLEQEFMKFKNLVNENIANTMWRERVANYADSSNSV